ncbi:MAG: aspartate aminotransferase [Cellvibrionaceae bacterium]|jgi:aspartate aminotransferase
MLEVLPHLSVDPILGLVVAYNEDKNPDKVDLGAGVYKNEHGHTPIMSAVSKAQQYWLQTETTKVYAPPAGFAGFNQGILELLFDTEHPVIQEERAISVQTPGGCGALRIAAGLINRCRPGARIWISNPSWANHIPLLGSVGLELVEYPYYDAQQHMVDFDRMMTALQSAEKGDLILLHGCCHNPSGADLTRDQWRLLTEHCLAREIVPFIDIAYQGLGDSLAEDVWGLRHMAERCSEVIVALSCSKNFGLYRERVGATVIVAANTETATVSRGQLLNIAREIYSMPPSCGAALVEIILNDKSLKQEWQTELTQVRQRIRSLREAFSQQFTAAGMGSAFDYISKEKGMFSFLNLSPKQVQVLRDRYSIYLLNSGRINIAGLNQQNMDYVVHSTINVIDDS